MPKLCTHENCKKRASYAFTYGNPDRCKQHKGDRKPQYSICQCGKARPSFNEPGEPKAICCKQCRTETMENVTHKMCKCGKVQPSYNEPGEPKPICCKECKTETMENVTHKMCKCGSKAFPIYNEPGEPKAICCKECKTETMKNVKDKMCKCGKAFPSFNEPGETKPICCMQCKTETMEDVKHKMCNANNETRCNTQGNRKYKGYCTHCFRHLFPKDPLTFQIRSKTKEIAVRDFINANFDGWQHDKCLYTGNCDCTHRRRIDHRVLIGNTLLVVETDENQHKSYEKMDEEIRHDDLFMVHGGKWIYIRFNPDKYKSNNGKNKNPEIATRLIELKKEIEKQIKRIKNEENTELIEKKYMYYDNYN